MTRRHARLFSPISIPPVFLALLMMGATAFAAATAAAVTAVPAMAWRAGEAVKLSEIGGADCLWKRGEEWIPLPLLDTEIELQVTGPMVRGIVKQRFLNAADEPIEALYVFPLPERAAVHAMELRVGSRKIVAIIKERVEARRRYEAAKREGRRAALVEQDRPNLFTTSISNILPGEEVSVELIYTQEIEFADGRFGLHFPLTFTPRFFPGAVHPDFTIAGGWGNAFARDEAIDRARVSPPFVRSEEPGAPFASIVVNLDPGIALAELDSPSHDVHVVNTGRRSRRVLTRETRVPADRDFLLEWRPLQGSEAASALFMEEGEDAAYALLMLIPPARDARVPRPTDTLFVVDISGSMDGPSIRAAREALLAALDRMDRRDRFAFLLFHDRQILYDEQFLPAQGRTLALARSWVARIRTRGGTMIHPALIRSLQFTERAAAEDPERLRRIIFLTDGAVGSEAEVLRTVAESIGETRIHTIGIGYAPNRYLMREMARLGRGSSIFLSVDDRMQSRMDDFLARLSQPALTDLWLGWEGVEVEEVYPSPLPDMHAGEALFISARLARNGSSGSARIRSASLLDERLLLSDARLLPAGAGLGIRWARAKVASLMDELHVGADSAVVKRQVVELALGHSLVTRYTSLVAVEKRPVVTEPGRSARVPNGLPSGSTLIGDATLPRGGTDAGLRRLLSVVFLSLAGVFAALHAWLRR